MLSLNQICRDLIDGSYLSLNDDGYPRPNRDPLE